MNVAGLAAVTELSFTREIARTPECARLARQFLEQSIPDSPLLDSTLLIVSELVTNAYVHGTGPIAMTVARQAGALHISVSSHVHDLGTVLVPRTVTSESDHGRGLTLVELLSESWEYSIQDLVLTVNAIVR